MVYTPIANTKHFPALKGESVKHKSILSKKKRSMNLTQKSNDSIDFVYQNNPGPSHRIPKYLQYLQEQIFFPPKGLSKWKKCSYAINYFMIMEIGLHGNFPYFAAHLPLFPGPFSICPLPKD